MRVALAVLAGIFAVCGAGLSSSMAKAEWSGWYPAGDSNIVGEPSIVHYGGKGSTVVAIAARGPDNALWYTESTDGIAFAPWWSYGGGITAPPSCFSGKPGHLMCFVRGLDGAVWTMNGEWTTWVSLGGYIDSNPAGMGKFANSRVVHGISGTQVHERRWTHGEGWAPWAHAPVEPLPAGTTLECDQFGSNLSDGNFREYRVFCLFRHPDNTVSGFEAVTMGQAAGDVHGFKSQWQGSLPEIPPSAYRPDVVLTGWKKGHVFVTALDGSVSTATWQSGVGFGPWEGLGGELASGPSCDGREGGDYQIICAGRAPDGSVWVNRLLK